MEDEAVVASGQAPEVAPAPDDRVPVNEVAVADAPRKGTEKCPFCGARKLKAAVPGAETPEEYCPGCGRGAVVEAV
jgi:hypothetical protein